MKFDRMQSARVTSPDVSESLRIREVYKRVLIRSSGPEELRPDYISSFKDNSSEVDTAAAIRRLNALGSP